ncbi:hypothetical protein PHET_07880 [Paragonimus heterotremus]|uniref:Uncharacterized protein n=1 Tax=Paragonimus heterotremus TaxID=100268 RepID=A0A8J4T4D3_9TREM|nr:hypothetical protein PHET_07880 [Paragonimus heterotremus]
MRPKNMIFLSLGFVILGFILLFVGAGMLVASTSYPSSDSAGATILRVSGRIACISGGLLIAATLCTCFYLCIIGAPSLDLSSTVSWSNTVAGFPRLPYRRRRHSLDRTGESFGHTSGIPMLLGAGDFNRMTTNRLWMPTLDNPGSATHSATDQISSELLGDCRMEPLGSMLHRGGHVKLGRAV